MKNKKEALICQVWPIWNFSRLISHHHFIFFFKDHFLSPSKTKKVQYILWFSNVISNYLHQKLHFFVKLKCQNKITPSSGSAFLGPYVYYNYIIQLPICFWHFALLLFTKLGYGILWLIPLDIIILHITYFALKITKWEI